MPFRHHRFHNGNIQFIAEHGDDQIKKVYAIFHGGWNYIRIPHIRTHTPQNQIKYTDFVFGNIYFQMLHENDTLILIRYKYPNLEDKFHHVPSFSTFAIDDDETFSADEPE